MIEDGGVQWMTAGRGIIHSEMPKVTEGDLWGFQLWLNLPAKDKMVKPRWGFRTCCTPLLAPVQSPLLACQNTAPSQHALIERKSVGV